MNKAQMPFVLVAGLCLALAGPALAAELPPVEEIFAKHTAAVGGDAIDEVKTIALEFTFSMAEMGLDTTGEAYMEVPDKSYTLVSLAAMGAGDFEDGTSGSVAWQNNPQMGYRLLDGIEKTMSLQRARLAPFKDWQDFWAKAETVGEEMVGEDASYKVVLTHADGGTINVYFDKEEGLVRKQEIPVPQMGSTVTVTPSDYRAVEGLTMPHRIDQTGPMTIAIVYTDVRINPDDIPEDVFDLPAEVVALTKK